MYFHDQLTNIQKYNNSLNLFKPHMHQLQAGAHLFSLNCFGSHVSTCVRAYVCVCVCVFPEINNQWHDMV